MRSPTDIAAGMLETWLNELKRGAPYRKPLGWQSTASLRVVGSTKQALTNGASGKQLSLRDGPAPQKPGPKLGGLVERGCGHTCTAFGGIRQSIQCDRVRPLTDIR